MNLLRPAITLTYAQCIGKSGMSNVFVPIEDPLVLASWAEVAPPSAVADFIAGRTYPEQRGLLCTSVFPELFVSAALKRNDHLITLALALHSDSATTLGRLWREACDDSIHSKALRRTVLANPHAALELTDEEWHDLVLTAGAEDVESYCRKPVIEQEALEHIIAGKGRFANLPEERRLLWALSALKNPNLHRTRPNPMRYPVDGWWDYMERKTSDAALKLLEWVPAQEPYAWALNQGISRFPRGFDAPVEVPKQILDKIGFGRPENREWEEWHHQANLDWLSKILHRWTVADANEDKSMGRHKNPYPNGFESLRMSIVSLIPAFRTELRKFVESHHDKWVRIGAIASQDFISAADVRSAVEREGFLVLCNAFGNPAFHSRSKPHVVHVFRSFYGARATRMAEAEGYDWEDTRFARSGYDQTADRLHGEDPGGFYAGAELPENDIDCPHDGSSSDVLPEPLRRWVRDLRKTASSVRDHRELGDMIVNLADNIARIQASNDFQRQDLMHNFRQLTHKLGVFYGVVVGAGIIAGIDYASRRVSDIWSELALWTFAIGVGIALWRLFEKG